MRAYYLKGNVNFFNKFGQNIPFFSRILVSQTPAFVANIRGRQPAPWPLQFCPFRALHLHAKSTEPKSARCPGDIAMSLVCHAAAFPLSDHQPWAPLPLQDIVMRNKGSLCLESFLQLLVSLAKQRQLQPCNPQHVSASKSGEGLNPGKGKLSQVTVPRTARSWPETQLGSPVAWEMLREPAAAVQQKGSALQGQQLSPQERSQAGAIGRGRSRWATVLPRQTWTKFLSSGANDFSARWSAPRVPLGFSTQPWPCNPVSSVNSRWNLYKFLIIIAHLKLQKPSLVIITYFT